MGRFHYLLGVLLLFISSFLWVASSLQKDSGIALTYGSCVCAEDNTNSTAIGADISPPQPPNITFHYEKPIPPPEKPYLPITNTHKTAQSAFPLKLWQKAGSKGISSDRWNDIQSWLKQNPTLRHEILTDGSADEYVRDNFAEYPEIRDLYLSLPVPILKADLLRQLILYNDGGIWSDLDVTCHKPIDTWITKEYRNRTNIVVGLEFDGSQFASWTVMTKPKTSHGVAVVKYVIEKLQASAAEHNHTTAELNMTMVSDVVDVTGPQAMTVALLQNLGREMGLPIGRANISRIMEPTLLQDVLVLPNAAFAALQAGHPEDRGPYLVEHHYAGSWKNVHGGE
jgi:mannosyltransferase OCH1-like enzyme